MTTADSCTVAALHRDGTPIAMIAWGRERGRAVPSKCHDCGVASGALHHPGCDLQRCPVCHGQMMSCGCRFDEDGPDPDEDDDDDDLYIDSNGRFTERVRISGQEVVVHDDDIPEQDITTVNGVRCTTALRTVIDIAPDLELAELERIVLDFLDREVFTVADARARLAEDDMLARPGADMVRRALPR